MDVLKARAEMESYAYKALGAFYTDNDPAAMPLLEEILEDVGLEDALAAAQVARRMYRDEAWKLDDPVQHPSIQGTHSFEGRLREAGVPNTRAADVVERIRVGALAAWGGKPDASDILRVLRRVNADPRIAGAMAYGALYECWERLWGLHASRRAAATCCATAAERGLAEALAEKGYLLCPPGAVPQQVWRSETKRTLLLLGAVPIPGHHVHLLALRPSGEGGVVARFQVEDAAPKADGGTGLREAGFVILDFPEAVGRASPGTCADQVDAALRALPILDDNDRMISHGNIFARVSDWSSHAIAGRGLPQGG